MLVHEWMTQNVITVTADTSMMKASRLMKEKRIGRLPVVDESNHIVGMVSDRDIKDASPSKATTLDTHELYYLLSEMKVKDIMTKENLITAAVGTTLEQAKQILLENRIEKLPIVKNNKLKINYLQGPPPLTRCRTRSTPFDTSCKRRHFASGSFTSSPPDNTGVGRR